MLDFSAEDIYYLSNHQASKTYPLTGELPSGLSVAGQFEGTALEASKWVLAQNRELAGATRIQMQQSLEEELISAYEWTAQGSSESTPSEILVTGTDYNSSSAHKTKFFLVEPNRDQMREGVPSAEASFNAVMLKNTLVPTQGGNYSTAWYTGLDASTFLQMGVLYTALRGAIPGVYAQMVEEVQTGSSDFSGAKNDLMRAVADALNVFDVSAEDAEIRVEGSDRDFDDTSEGWMTGGCRHTWDKEFIPGGEYIEQEGIAGRVAPALPLPLEVVVRWENVVDINFLLVAGAVTEVKMSVHEKGSDLDPWVTFVANCINHPKVGV